MLTTIWLTYSLEKTIKEGEVAHLIMQYNNPVTFTILYSGVQDVMKCCVCKEDTVALAYCFSS